MRTGLSRIVTSSVLIVFILATLFAYPQPVSAAGYIMVTTTEDKFEAASVGAVCSLREAIASANDNKSYGGCQPGGAGTDKIVLPAIPAGAPSTTYTLKISGASENNDRTGDLDILGSVEIIGDGANLITVNGAKIDRVFHIQSTGPVWIAGMRITGGSGVVNGGGIFVDSAPLFTLSLAILDQNTAQVTGGGIHVSEGSVAVIDSTDIWKNTAHSESGGVSRSAGGGVFNEGTVTVTRSLIHENTADIAGGGMDNNARGDGKAVIVNTTIAGNSSPSAAGVWIAAYTEILNSTIVDNAGVGLRVIAINGGWMKNTIVARQTGSNCSLDSGVSISSGYNIDSDGTCGLTKAGDQSGVAAAALIMDSTLAPHGGFSATFEVHAASAAQAKGSGCSPVDQRNYARVTCDVGAYAIDGLPLNFFINIPYVRR